MQYGYDENNQPAVRKDRDSPWEPINFRDEEQREKYAQYYPPEEVAAGAEPVRLTGSDALGFINEVGQGATFGALDEILGYGRAGVDQVLDFITGQDLARSPSEHMGDVREFQEDYREENPWWALGGNVLGGLATGGLTGRAVTGLAPGLARPGFVPSLTRNVGEGAVTGSLAGALGADSGDWSNIGEKAFEGGLEGTLFGAAMPVLNLGREVTHDIWDALRRRFGTDPDAIAERKVASAFGNIDMDNVQAQRESASRVDQGVPEDFMLADVRGGPRLLTQGLGTAEEANPIVDLAITGRHANQAGDLRRELSDTLGVDTDRFWDFHREVDRVQKAQARELYDAAYARPVPHSDVLRGMLDRPAIRRAWNRAQEISANRGEPFPTGPEITDVMPSLEGWDWIKRGLDDLISNERKQPYGMTGEGRELVRLKNELLGYLDDAVPEYREARNQYSNWEGIKDAMVQGRRIFLDDWDETSEYMRGLSDSERQAFLVGVSREITDEMKRAPVTGNPSMRAKLRSPLYRERLQQAFPDEGTFNQFIERLDMWADRGDLRNKTLENSQTAQRMEAIRAVRDEEFEELQPGQGDWVTRLFNRLARRPVQGEEVQRMADMMTSTDPDEINRIIDTIQNLNDPTVLGSFSEPYPLPPELGLTVTSVLSNLAGQDAIPGLEVFFGE